MNALRSIEHLEKWYRVLEVVFVEVFEVSQVAREDDSHVAFKAKQHRSVDRCQ